jgi:hypothetical protein
VVHGRLTHSEKREYKCKPCDELILLSEKVKHIKEVHKKFHCDFCDYIGDVQNKKRHLTTKHKGLTPALSALVTKNNKKQNRCDQCKKDFFCKSNLNKHIVKVHNKNSNVPDLKDNKIPKEKDNIIKHFNDAQKQIKFKDDIKQVVEIPFTKTPIQGMEVELIHIFNNIEKIMALVTNRKQKVTATVMIEMVERMTKKEFNILHFRVLVTFGLFNVDLVDNELEVSVNELKMTPAVNTKRLEILKRNIEEASTYKYVDLIDFPEKTSWKYQSAKDIIEQNIFKVNEIPEGDKKDEGKAINVIDSILKKIKEKERKKKNRSDQFNKIDWQKKSMPKLARMINTIFICEKKSTLHENFLIEKVEYSGFRTVRKVENDIDRLIKMSSGWLRKTGKGWIRRNIMMDINIVCDSLI